MDSETVRAEPGGSLNADATVHHRQFANSRNRHFAVIRNA